MQAVKENLTDAQKVKAEARAEEQEEKEIAKARKEIAHEVRLAKEAEAAMDMHVAKAGRIAQKEVAKHPNQDPAQSETQGKGCPTNPPLSVAGNPPSKKWL